MAPWSRTQCFSKGTDIGFSKARSHAIASVHWDKSRRTGLCTTDRRYCSGPPRLQRCGRSICISYHILEIRSASAYLYTLCLRRRAQKGILPRPPSRKNKDVACGLLLSSFGLLLLCYVPFLLRTIFIRCRTSIDLLRYAMVYRNLNWDKNHNALRIYKNAVTWG